ncbi:MAG: hypothetical protein HYS81_01330 [Candidatus Aenigmatarchaeota archaeon]|nr:MAG: hypothetical protein HYS81_01330 [Candidatus Aenigmarchaeota archaeon]
MAILDPAKALIELKEKTMNDIERATATTWGGRALASFKLVAEQASLMEKFRHFYEAENYRQEALEHASMTEDRGALLVQIHDEIEEERQKALKLLKGE